MRTLKALLTGFGLFLCFLFIALCYSIATVVTNGPAASAHAVGLSAILGGFLEATVATALNPLTYTGLAACLLAGYALTKPRNAIKSAS